MKKSTLEITDTKVYLPKKMKTDSSFKASVKVILNDCLVLNGLRIIKGQFGHYISFPQQKEGSPFKIYDILSSDLRKRFQNEILKEYAKTLAAALPVAA